MKKERPKMTKDVVPENFTLALAAVDAIPVLFFGGTMVLVGTLFSSPLFLIGALLALFAGAAKVLWKFIVVLQKKNVWWLFLQMRILMPLGMLLMLAALLLRASDIRFSSLWAAVTAFPAGLFFGLGLFLMLLMIVFAVKLDSSDVRSNWIEQGTNGIAQAAFFFGTLTILLAR